MTITIGTAGSAIGPDATPETKAEWDKAHAEWHRKIRFREYHAESCKGELFPVKNYMGENVLVCVDCEEVGDDTNAFAQDAYRRIFGTSSTGPR